MAGIWEIGFWNVSFMIRMYVLCQRAQAVCTNNVIYGEHLLSFPFQDSGILTSLQYMNCPSNNFKPWVSNGLPWTETLSVWLHLRCWREGVLCEPPQEDGRAQEACTHTAKDSIWCLFPYDPAEHPCCVTVMNLSCKYDYMLSPVCLSTKPPNMWMILGDPPPKHYAIFPSLKYSYTQST